MIWLWTKVCLVGWSFINPSEFRKCPSHRAHELNSKLNLPFSVVFPTPGPKALPVPILLPVPCIRYCSLCRSSGCSWRAFKYCCVAPATIVDIKRDRERFGKKKNWIYIYKSTRRSGRTVHHRKMYRTIFKWEKKKFLNDSSRRKIGI